MIKNREHVWLLLLGALFLPTISAAFGQDKCTNQSGWIGAGGYCPVDQKYAREARRQIRRDADRVKDLQGNMAPSVANEWYLSLLEMDLDIERMHLSRYEYGEPQIMLEDALRQFSRDAENVPPGFRTVKQ